MAGGSVVVLAYGRGKVQGAQTGGEGTSASFSVGKTSGDISLLEKSFCRIIVYVECFCKL